MDREPLNCAHDPSSSGPHGGDGGGSEGAAGIWGFKILDVQDLREGGDEPDVLTGKMGPAEAVCLSGNAHRTSNGIQVKEDLSEVSRSAQKGSTTTFSTFSFPKNVRKRKRKSYLMKFMDYKNNLSHDQVNMDIDTCEKTDNGTECKTSPKDSSKKIRRRRRTVGKCHECTTCNKPFKFKSELLKHIRTHTGEKPYKCTDCTKSFASHSNWQTHVRTHTGEKPYECLFCSKSFGHPSNWNVHMRGHTGEKPFQCSVCNKSFTLNQNRQKHMRIHTGEKPHTCSICKKSFTQISASQAHMRTHTGEKPFHCSFCSKSFSQTSGRKVHMRTHTVEKPYNNNNNNNAFILYSAFQEAQRRFDRVQNIMHSKT
uniref:zinc finger protein OZF-like isoform X1 n=1 Tax=Myxine glutinosa TaxID=7769 RepID=UPI00358E9359